MSDKAIVGQAGPRKLASGDNNDNNDSLVVLRIVNVHVDAVVLLKDTYIHDCMHLLREYNPTYRRLQNGEQCVCRLVASRVRITCPKNANCQKADENCSATKVQKLYLDGYLVS